MPTTNHPYIPAIYTQVDRGTYALQVCGRWFLVYLIHLNGSYYQLTICSVNSELAPLQSTFTSIEQELYTLQITETLLEDAETLFKEIVEESAVLLRSSYGHPGVLLNLIHTFGGKSPLGHSKKQRLLNTILH